MDELWSPRAKAYLLLSTGGWVALVLSGFQIVGPYPGPLALVIVGAGLGGLVACLFGVIMLVRVSLRAPENEPGLEPGIDALVREWRRVGAFARESFAQSIMVFPLLVLIAILLLDVLHNTPAGGGSPLMQVWLWSGFAFTLLGTALSAITMARETLR